MPLALKRYELFGWDYERICPLTEREVAWYRRFAEAADGPVLELACGTGRLACRLAEAAREVVAVDLCDAMLRLARQRAASLPPDVRKRVRFVRADMTGFGLGRKFALILIADNSIRELDTLEEYRACLRRVAEHIGPGGVFLVTVRRFDPSRFREGVREYDWSQPLPSPETGDQVSRRIEVRLLDGGQTLRGNMIYKSVSPDGAERIDECPFRAPVLRTEDYVRLFREAGFGVKVYVGYEQVADDGAEPILCFVCRKE